MKAEKSLSAFKKTLSQAAVCLQTYHGDHAMIKKGGPFISFVAPCLAPTEGIPACYHGAPAVLVLGLGKKFAKLVRPVPNAPFDIKVMTLRAATDYPLVGVIFTGPKGRLCFLMDPFTPNGRELVRRWHEANRLAIVFNQPNVYIDAVGISCPDAVSALLACPTPERYNEKVPLPVFMLASVHEDLGLPKTVLIATFDIEKGGNGCRPNVTEASVPGTSTTVH